MPISFEGATKQLEEAVRQLVKLNTRNAQGETQRKTLEGARRQAESFGASESELRIRFKELDPVELEPGTEYLLDLFDELSRKRRVQEHGPMALADTEIKAFCELTETQLEHWEVHAIHVMDRAFIDEARRINEARIKSTKATSKSKGRKKR